MIFIFVPFAAWYTGGALSWDTAPVFVSSTLLSSFVAPITGLPFVMDLLDIPQKTFQLFVVSTVITDRIRVVLGAFHLITLTLLTIAAGHGLLKLKPGKLIQGLTIVFLAGAISVYGMNKLLEKSMENIPSNVEIVNSFKIISPQQPYKILRKPTRNPNGKWRGENTLSRIKRRNKIRIGFYKDAMPFSFFNNDSLLVGYGIDLAHQLATDLQVNIEFVPVDPGRLVEEMKADYFDIVMSDIFISSKYAQELALSKPYLNVSLALLVPKDNDAFDDFKSTIELDTFTISYFARPEIAQEFLSFFPNGSAYEIHNFDQFFNQKEDDSVHIDAHLTSAERASALTIFHPDYKVVNPLPYHINNALVFPLAHDDVWTKYVDKWIDYRTKDGTFDKIYNQWILGNPYRKKEKPWSFYENVIKKNSDKER
jgi:ABC-type amino acid transport substrate-binding protein